MVPDSRASKTRAPMKIIPCEKGKMRRGREKNEGLQTKSKLLTLQWPTDFGVWSLYCLSNQLSVTKWDSFSHWAVNAIVISKHQVLIVAGASWKSIVRAALKVKSLGFACSPSFFSLSVVCRLSHRGWFLRMHVFCSLYYPWGKMGEYS